MIQNFLRVGATIYKWAALAWVVACALWVLAHYGISGLFSVAIFSVFVFLVFARNGEKKRRDTEYVPPWLGPTDYHRHHDPAYKDLYPWNFFNDGK